MQMLQNLKISETISSSTNVKGRTEGAGFKDLVESVRVQGVLVPVLARKVGSKFEVIAGNRRLAAAKEVGLDSIPAKIVTMTDDEAREAQIIENLQREDVNPLDEGLAYRDLHESGRTIEDIAARVGKSDKYVRSRLFITNLSEKSQKAYRVGTLLDSHAQLIARLTKNGQDLALKHIADETKWGGQISVRELKDWIVEEFDQPLKNQPWIKDEKMREVVGSCTMCPPNTVTLFGERREGECSDLKCWKIKMDRFIAHKISSAASSGQTMLRVSKQYGTDDKTVLGLDNYKVVSKNKKDLCDYAQPAIVVEGEDIGQVLNVCASADCKIHRKDITPYVTTPQEKERRKKERAAEKAKKEREEKSLAAAMEVVKYPVSENLLTILLELSLHNSHHDVNMRTLKRYGLEPKRTVSSWGTHKDYSTPLKTFAANANNDQKLKLMTELMLGWQWNKPEVISKILKSADKK